MTKSDEALATFMSGFTCSSAVFSTFSEEIGLDPDTARKVACGFGGAVFQRRGISAGQYPGPSWSSV
jgi:hypothetical protein